MKTADRPSARNRGELSVSASDLAASVLKSIVLAKADELVELFYDAFLEDEEASAFLSHSVVHDRLSHSLRDWLLELLQTGARNDQIDFADRQRAIGEVHARIKIPIHLVLEGASLIKRTVAHYVMRSSLDRETLGEALILLNHRVDCAMQFMSQAYVSGTMRRAQLDESFRLFSLGQDITLERETQRAALMEWSQNILFTLFGAGPAASLKPISSSPFGLWFYHRAGILFQEATILESIDGAIQQIDKVLLPKLHDARTAGSSTLAEPLERLQALIEEIKLLMTELFQNVVGLENGRDPLTRTLNRRFLPSILSREVAIAGRNGTPFTILMIDIDNFKNINDQWGHSAGDLVLRQIAEIILDTVRPSDFVFRYGGEEFLVGLVEADVEQGFQVAERIRQVLMAHELRLSDETKFSVTTSIGLAAYEGHPDYAYLVEAADKALYEAKRAGRNQTIIASS